MRCVETHTIKQSTPQRKGSLKIHPHSKRPANHETPPPLRHPAPRSRFNRPRGRLRQRAQRRTSLSGCLPPRERRIEPADYIARYEAQLRFIERFHHQPRTIVLTHFPPHPACIAPQYTDSPLNPYFINDIDLNGFAYWLAGHTHQAFDDEQDGCRIIINPLGYPNEIGQNGYRDGLLLELPD